jgi:hypothetical protein
MQDAKCFVPIAVMMGSADRLVVAVYPSRISKVSLELVLRKLTGLMGSSVRMAESVLFSSLFAVIGTGIHNSSIFIGGLFSYFPPSFRWVAYSQ